MFGQESKIEAGEMDRRGKQSGKRVLPQLYFRILGYTMYVWTKSKQKFSIVHWM